MLDASDCFYDEDAGLDLSWCRMPTRRPLSRPQSARMNRNIDAAQYRNALRQIMADQRASVQDARFFKELANAEVQDQLREQNLMKAIQVNDFKENERRCMAQRAALNLLT